MGLYKVFAPPAESSDTELNPSTLFLFMFVAFAFAVFAFAVFAFALTAFASWKYSRPYGA